MVNVNLSTFYSKAYTFTTDTAIRIESDPSILLSALNIHCYTNAVLYGSGVQMTTTTAGAIQPNAVVWFDGAIRPYDIIFKNYTNGSNATVVLNGIVKGQ